MTAIGIGLGEARGEATVGLEEKEVESEGGGEVFGVDVGGEGDWDAGAGRGASWTKWALASRAKEV